MLIQLINFKLTIVYVTAKKGLSACLSVFARVGSACMISKILMIINTIDTLFCNPLYKFC